MFCSKCGEKVEAKDKFCPKCGHSVSSPFPSQKEEDEDKKTTPITPAPTQNRGCLSCLLILFTIFAFFSLIGVLTYASGNKDKGNTTGLVVGTVIFSLTFLSLGIWGLVKLNRKNKLARENKTTTSASHENKTVETVSQEKKKNGSCVTIMVIFFVIATIIILVYSGKKIIKTEDKTDEPTTQNWDGNYNAKMAKPNCDSSVEFTSFQVSNNAVVNNWGKNAPIGTDGRATIIMDTGTVMTTDLTFTKDGVTGAWKTTRGCSGTLSATKSSSWF